jgi:hypothetical protein
MKKLLITLIGSFALGAALPALAGPDWQLIEKARKAKQASAMARQGDSVSGSGTSGARGAKCPVQSLVLPLDHGPRAETTPYQNELRKQRHEAALKACEGTTK